MTLRTFFTKKPRLTLMDKLRARFPFVFFRAPIDRSASVLTFVYSKPVDDGSSVLSNLNLTYGEVNILRNTLDPEGQIIAAVGKIVGKEHERVPSPIVQAMRADR